MDRGFRQASVFTIVSVLFTLSVGCADIPEYYGPLCDKAATGDWSPASTNPELDHVEYATWTRDPELEQLLRSYGMDDGWDFLSGNDVNEDGVVVSPYGKTLNAYELIVNTPGLRGWDETLRQGFPVHGSCGEKAAGVVAYTWWGKSGNRTDVYQSFYNRNVVSRAGFLIHEAGHAAGLPNHVNDKDQSWDDFGPYRLQLEFLAALYHADGASEAHKEAARAEFEWINMGKFVEPTGLTLEDLRPKGQ